MKYFQTYLILIFVLTTKQLLSQSTVNQVNYKVKSLQNLEEINNPEAKSYLNDIYKGFNNLTYVLVFNKTESVFEESQNMESDKDKESLIPSMSQMMAFTGRVYTNTTSGFITQQKKLSSDVFLIQYSINEYKWKLSKESKKIGNYTSFKASLTDTVETVRGKRAKLITAWYVPELPYPFGPTEYTGLPGLIIELEINNNIVFYADKILLQTENNTIPITQPKKGKKVTKQQYADIEKKGFQNYKRN